jgi:hypothetical protein
LHCSYYCCCGKKFLVSKFSFSKFLWKNLVVITVVIIISSSHRTLVEFNEI